MKHKPRQSKDDFMVEIEERLEENRRLMREVSLPKPLANAASYLGFHAFSSLLILSLLATVVLYGAAYEWLMEVSKKIFIFL